MTVPVLFLFISEKRTFESPVPQYHTAMQETTVTAIEAIQAILAPALGMSAVGLLLLGLSSRYSLIVNRIRLLNEEKRRYTRELVKNEELSYADNARFMSITTQTSELLLRSRLVRNAILAMQTSIGLFVASSAAIGLNLFVSSSILRFLPLIVFITGMLAVFVGILYAGLEIHRSFKAVLIEVKADE
jgi:Protein of unknown function (DUF2721)